MLRIFFYSFAYKKNWNFFFKSKVKASKFNNNKKKKKIFFKLLKEREHLIFIILQGLKKKRSLIFIILQGL